MGLITSVAGETSESELISPSASPSLQLKYAIKVDKLKVEREYVILSSQGRLEKQEKADAYLVAKEEWHQIED